MGVSKNAHASAIPSMASTIWAMISGRSGLPKLRLLVAATGSAPTAERLRQHSATSRRAPSRGERAVAAVPVDRHGDAGSGFLNTDDGCVAAGAREGVGANGVVVLLPDP